jgi:D-alanyl-D-alanine carboxypeptidase (penicillin-binding protein 5/6)
MKLLPHLLTAAYLLLSGTFAFAVDAIPAPPQLNAKSWLLLDANTGTVMLEHGADEKLPPASLTKLMTSYVLGRELEAGRVHNEDMVTISKNAWSQNPLFGAKFNGSSLMFIAPDKPVSIQDLHRGIVISSGNDATVAVAEHVAGTETAFADIMNQNAKALGMNNTHFVNPHGLDDPNHYTTARDLALLARAITHQRDYALHKEREFTYNKIKQVNRNGLLWTDPTVDGLKTGHTDGAGYCLVASAVRDGMRLVSVVMGAPSIKEREAQSESLLNYGYRYFQTRVFFAANSVLATPRVWKGKEDSVAVIPAQAVSMTVLRNIASDLTPDVRIDNPLIAPINKGQKVGQVNIMHEGKILYSVDAVAEADVPRGNIFRVIWDTLKLSFSTLFGIKT